jgi:ligand-binding sensor domain-containing protein
MAKNLTHSAIVFCIILIGFSCKKTDSIAEDPESYFEKIQGPAEAQGQGPNDIELDPSGNLWAAFAEGVGVYRGGVWTFYRPFPQIPNNASSGNYAWSVMVDRQGNTWAAIDSYNDMYACRLNGENWDKWSLPRFAVKRILHMPDGEIWFFSDRGGIHIYNGTFFDRGNVTIYTIMSAFIDKDKQLWMGSTRNRFYKFIRKWEFQEFYFYLDYGQTFADLVHIGQSKAGNLMLSLNPGGARLFEANRYIPLPNETTETGPVTATFEDSRNRLWIGTMSKGIFLKEGNTIQSITLGGQADGVKEFLEDSSGDIWISCPAGIFRYRKK